VIFIALKRPTTRGGWKAPAVGSKARKEMPRSAFLKPSTRKYPYKVYRNGKWVASETGLMAAMRRAAQQGATTTKKKACTKLNAIRRKKGKPLVCGAKR